MYFGVVTLALIIIVIMMSNSILYYRDSMLLRDLELLYYIA